MTIHADFCKVWDALTGKLTRVFRKLTRGGSDITAFCLDDRKRKFIIGDHDGHILVYNFQSGVMMKALDSHSGQVSGLVYKTMSKAVLSVSWDRAVVVHDEAMRERGKIIRIMDPVQQHQDDITALACMEGTFFWHEKFCSDP